MANSQLGPVTLVGRRIQLDPLVADDAEALAQAARDPAVSTYLPVPLFEPGTVRQRVTSALAQQERGLEYFFVVRARTDGQVLGSTAYLDISAANRAVEIGWTWYVPEVWGAGVNPEAKYLLLQHAFEDWGAIRVFLKTDARNLRSQAAIKKLGARYEGTLRSHRILPDGYRRDSVYFSILDHEWPEAKAGLENRLANLE